jgi:hypothetical protein
VERGRSSKRVWRGPRIIHLFYPHWFGLILNVQNHTSGLRRRYSFEKPPTFQQTRRHCKSMCAGGFRRASGFNKLSSSSALLACLLTPREVIPRTALLQLHYLLPFHLFPHTHRHAQAKSCCKVCTLALQKLGADLCFVLRPTYPCPCCICM